MKNSTHTLPAQIFVEIYDGHMPSVHNAIKYLSALRVVEAVDKFKKLPDGSTDYSEIKKFISEHMEKH